MHSNQKQSLSSIFAIIVIILLVFLVFSNTISYDFLNSWDDPDIGYIPNYSRNFKGSIFSKN